ncbi:MAG: hypothetical protein ACI9UA_005205 [Pseudoalteromonas tetraodonis]|jgi:hypothetical protein
MARKKKPKSSAPASSKLIVPGSETGSKSQLLVPGGEMGASIANDPDPAAEPAQPALVTEGTPPEAGGDEFTVINEDYQEPEVAEPEVAEPEQTAVKITAMVPPSPEVEEEVAAEPEVETYMEPVAPVAMEAPEAQVYAQEAQVDELPAEQAYYEAPAEPVYEEPATEAWEQPQQEVLQPEYYEQQAPQVPPPTMAVPAEPAAYSQYAPPPMQGPPPQQPYGYGPPPGYQQPGQQPPMYPGANMAPMRNVPSWALILVGSLVGFLAAMMIFKFTGMGAALRADLIKEGRDDRDAYYKKVIDQLKDDGYGVEEEQEPEVKDEEGEAKPDAEGEDEAAEEVDAEPEL